MSNASNTPLISVVTVCFGALGALRLTCRSVAEAQGASVEHVVWDGGSDDGTPEWLATQGSGLVWHSQRDGGIYDAMNRAVALCSAEWVLFLNAADTFYSPHTLSEVSDRLRTTRADVVYGDTVYDYGDRQHLLRATSRLSDLEKRMIFCHQSVFVRRRVLVAHPFDTTYLICADFDLFHKLYRAGFSFDYLGRGYAPLSVYEARDGVSSRQRVRLAHEVYRIRTAGRDDLGWWYVKFLLVGVRDFLFKRKK